MEMHKTGKSNADAVKEDVVNLIELNPYLMRHDWCDIAKYIFFQDVGIDQKQSRPGRISDNNGHIFINLLPKLKSKGSLGSESMGLY